jgi:hypothetical protein
MMHEVSRRDLLSLRLFLSGVALATLIAGPASVLASTSPETPPPPCAFELSTAVAGTPVEISGPISPPDASVEISVERADKRSNQVTVATINGVWRGVLLFGAADAGLWTIHVSIGGADECQSPITVTLPAGVVAPPTQPPVTPATDDVQPTPGFDGTDLRGLAIEAVVVLVVASWIFLALAGLARIVGARPLVRRWLRVIAVPATFLGVWGGLMAIVLIVDIAVSMSHFDTGTPAGDQALIDAGIWVVAVGGAILGTLAALRVRRETTSTPR